MPVFNNILAGSSGQGDTGYDIGQSLRFEDSDNTYLNRTFGSVGNRKTWTYSVWVKKTIPDSAFDLFTSDFSDSNNLLIFNLRASNATESKNYTSSVQWRIASGTTYTIETSQKFRDPSGWYHLVLTCDTTEASATDRLKLYVNGSEVTDFDTDDRSNISQNADTAINRAAGHQIGAWNNTSTAEGYLAEVNFIDGTALDASNFGETDLLTNQWIPKKYVGTYGTNGFYLNFSNSASLGADSSGNGNNFTPTNLAATDQVLDSPTNNFATLNPLAPDTTGSTAHSFSEGNLKVSTSSNNWWNAFGTIGLPSGKWYFEYCAVGSGTVDQNVGVTVSDWYRGSGGGIDTAGAYSLYSTSGGVGLLYTDGSYVNNGSSWAWTWGDIVNFAIDVDTGKIWYGINGTWLGSGNPASGTNQAHTVSATNLAKTLLPAFSGYHTGGTPVINFGQDSSFAGNKTAQNNTDGNGKGDFYYAPPSGYLALCEDNLSDPSIALPGDHFNTVLYTGNSTSQSITGVGFQPDFTWIKSRSTAGNHRLHNVITYGGPISGGSSGIKYLESNTTNAETSSTTKTLISLDSDGFSLYGDGGDTNQSSITYASWNWKADNTSGSSNTDGTITSTVSANPTAGFSIVTCTTLAGLQSVGHGLSQAPEIVIQKPRNSVQSWYVYYDFVDGSQDYLTLNTDTAASAWGGSAATSTVFYENWGSGFELVCYCFHSVEGYSKIGSYTGNGSTDGTFVYTGFRPAFVMFKSTAAGDSWTILDNQRDPYNKMDTSLFPNLTSADTTQTNNECDFLSNGVKIRNSLSRLNGNGTTYIYMAFAESPFKYSNAR